jgi:hypothetical protein
MRGIAASNEARLLAANVIATGAPERFRNSERNKFVCTKESAAYKHANEYVNSYRVRLREVSIKPRSLLRKKLLAPQLPTLLVIHMDCNGQQYAENHGRDYSSKCAWFITS